MTAEPWVEPEPDDPSQLLSILPGPWHGQFLVEYRAALDTARNDLGQWSELRAVLHRWRLRAVAYSAPGFETAAAAARETEAKDLHPIPGWEARQ
ncbi:DUF6247 family protein [Tsukamurella pseudospumae]|uniref:Uncharacterized protein n=1 Tax=Tsukamurella pseudospumae TaxID=239498 RepID=A0A138ATS0_9ACTN|nr:DUF6247 family protein [Tsukamurella pseudospumae]KXP00966.1 hypothetical protein AXK61_13290 [Tsukamurella pseudospumae]KXP13786.1 hypothetical protein AXK60_23380 [Tsukamurella pseudospumae]